MDTVTIASLGVSAASVAALIVLAILYGRAVKEATQKAAFESQVKSLTTVVKNLTALVEEKEGKLRELNQKFVAKLSTTELVSVLGEIFPAPSSGAKASKPGQAK